MTIISLIAAIDNQGGLGKDNKLLWHLPADLKHFKMHTLGKPIIMGSNTLRAIGRTLPGRMNIVLSHHLQSEGDMTVVDSLEAALALTKDFPETMVIGGANVYAQALAQASRIYLTVVEHRFAADVFFPTIDPHMWRCQEAQKRPRDHANAYDMTFYYYERVSG